MAGTKASTSDLTVALDAQSVALNAAGALPAEIMLMPAGVVRTADGRGPYRVENHATVFHASLSAAGGRLPIDVNHSTDLAAPKGGESPARGWITALHHRDTGVWGTVEWTKTGGDLLADQAYRFISPVITHLEDGRVTGILRAALTNTPNLRGMPALHAEGSNMDMLVELRKILGLAVDADAPAVIAAVKSKCGGGDKTAMQAALSPIAKAAGLNDDADATAILGAVTTLAATATKTAADNPVVVALQAELGTVTTKLNTLTSERVKEVAIAFVDGAIKEGRMGIKPMRDEYIAMHMENPERLKKLVNGMPILTGTSIVPPADKDGKVSLQAEHMTAAKALGIKPEEYLKTLQAESEAQL